MVNLLPLSEKLHIRKLYKRRLLVVTLLFSLIIMDAGVITLLPTLFWSFVKENTIRKQLSIIEQIVSSEERKNIKERVANINKKIMLLSEEGDKSTPLSKVIEKIIMRKNFDISITSFFYEDTHMLTQGERVTVSGISGDRRSLLSFVNEMRQENTFSDVNLPVSNFVKNTDIPFSVSLLIHKNANTQ